MPKYSKSDRDSSPPLSSVYIGSKFFLSRKSRNELTDRLTYAYGNVPSFFRITGFLLLLWPDEKIKSKRRHHHHVSYDCSLTETEYGEISYTKMTVIHVRLFPADMPSLPVKIMIAPKPEDNIHWERNYRE